MRTPLSVIEIFLQPGDFYFGDRDTRIRTLLGSCISIVVWHPQRLIGGMCHYMLPTRGKKRTGTLDGRYGDEALVLFLKEIQAAGTRPAEYEAKLFGGSNMFTGTGKIRCPEINCADPFTASCKDISCRNRRSARLLAERHGFAVTAEKLGGTQPHNILFDLWSGHVWIKRPPKGLACTGKTLKT
ncbi:MAG: chemotaxis protein CheD [Sulfuricella sp.]|nr:chemotaxis protein CheD [Sulfuricella sp.]